jgi:hypothetical protein
MFTDHIKIDFINKMSEPNTQIVKKQAKKCFFEYTKENFSMYTIWLKDFFYIHHKIYEFIGDNLENFYKFFDWLNYSKFMFEIKRKFMTIAYEIMFERLMRLMITQILNHPII